MNPYLNDWLIRCVGLAIGTGIIAVPYTIWHKNHETPYEKKLRKQWEQEQRENQEFRKNIKVDQGYESWKKEKETQEQ